MENLCAELMEEVETQGELSPYGRERLWKMLKSGTDSATAKTKRITLELGCLQKVMDSWAEDAPLSAKLQDLCKKIVSAIQASDSRTLETFLPQFYEECGIQSKEETNFYVSYLKQSMVYLMYIVDDIPEESLNDITVGNYDLDSDEWDTACCACKMYAYHNLAVSDNERKRRELEFWDWYIREAAKSQGIVIRTTVKIPEELLEEAETEINSIEDFVKYVSYEYDYEKYEVKEGKLLLIYVSELKDGAPCPDCRQFSNHVKMDCGYGSERMGKMKGWTIEFKVRQNAYYCDNPICQKEWFFIENNVLYAERHTHFSRLKSIPGMPEKICALFGIE